MDLSQMDTRSFLPLQEDQQFRRSLAFELHDHTQRNVCSVDALTYCMLVAKRELSTLWRYFS